MREREKRREEERRREKREEERRREKKREEERRREKRRKEEKRGEKRRGEERRGEERRGEQSRAEESRGETVYPLLLCSTPALVQTIPTTSPSWQNTGFGESHVLFRCWRNMTGEQKRTHKDQTYSTKCRTALQFGLFSLKISLRQRTHTHICASVLCRSIVR